MDICVIMCRIFFQGIDGLRFAYKKFVKRKKNVHMSKVIFIVMYNNTQILNFI